jgi:hypothetical protein
VAVDRSRRFEAWAAAVARTPDPGSPRLADVARRELGELVAAGREAVAERLAELGRGDPARAHAKRLRRARRRLHARATVAVGFAGLTGAAVAASAPEVAEVGLGAGAVLVGAAAVKAGRRLGRLRREPPPPRRPARPPKDSPARPPLDRLATQEQTLHALLAHLGEAAVEPRRVAAAAASGLRELGARLTAVHRAHRVSGGLHDAVAALREQLDAGITGYAPSLQEATDALAGLAAGLRAVA